MVPYYVQSISYDGTKVTALLGDQEITPYAEGIKITLDWLQSGE